MLAPQSLLLAMLVPLAACSLPRTSTDAIGPDFELTQERSAVEYSVTLCIDSPDIDFVEAFANISAEVEVHGTTEPVTVIGRTAEPDTDDFTDDVAEREFQTGEAESFYFDIGSEGPWQGQSGLRCGEPQVVVFEYDALPEGARVEIDWTVTFDAMYDDWMHGGDQLHEDSLIIEIEPVA